MNSKHLNNIKRDYYKLLDAVYDNDYGYDNIDEYNNDCLEYANKLKESLEEYIKDKEDINSMNKFKVGDIIVANDDNNINTYCVTCKDNNFVGEVIEVINNEEIVVKVLECDTSKDIGTDFNVQSVYFELEEEKNKTMNMKEAIKYLLDNPDKELLLVKDYSGIDFKDRNLRLLIKDGSLQFSDGYFEMTINEDGDKREFKVYEPVKKLKIMSYGEAMYKYDNGIICCNDYDIVSVKTGRTYADYNLTLEEYEGLWTIEGVYDDE